MALVNSGLDSLPYIDAPPTDAQRAAALSLIHAELPPSHTTTPHPNLPALILPTPTPATTHLLTLASASPPQKLSAIDLTRYSSAALEPPSSSPSDPEHLSHWRETISRAYTLYSYLSARNQQLSLLEAYGKNAWLVGNARVEEELRAVERLLGEVRERTEEVNRGRRDGQEGVRGELEGLESAWREGVRRLVGVMVATAELGEGRG